MLYTTRPLRQGEKFCPWCLESFQKFQRKKIAKDEKNKNKFSEEAMNANFFLLISRFSMSSCVGSRDHTHSHPHTHIHTHLHVPTHLFTHTNSLPRPFGTTVSKLQRRKEEKPILISRTWTPFLHFLDYYI